MPAFLSTIYYILSFNMMAILFFGAAIYFGKRGKSFKSWYLAGLLLQGYSVFGTVLGMVKQPEQWRTVNNYLSIAAFAVLAAAAALYLWRSHNSKKD